MPGLPTRRGPLEGFSAKVGAECRGCAPRNRVRGVPVPPGQPPPEPGVAPGRPQLLRAPQPPPRRPGLPRSPHAPTGRGRCLGPGPGAGGRPHLRARLGPGPRDRTWPGGGRGGRMLPRSARGRAGWKRRCPPRSVPVTGRPGGGGGGRSSLPPSPGGTGAAGALGCPPPREGQGLAGLCRLGREADAPSRAGRARSRRDAPGCSARSTRQRGKCRAQLGPFSETDPQAPRHSSPARHLLPSPSLSSLRLEHRGAPQSRALPSCSTLTLGRVRQGPFSAGAYHYGDSEQLSSNQGLLDPNSLPGHE